MLTELGKEGTKRHLMKETTIQCPIIHLNFLKFLLPVCVSLPSPNAIQSMQREKDDVNLFTSGAATRTDDWLDLTMLWRSLGCARSRLLLPLLPLLIDDHDGSSTT